MKITMWITAGELESFIKRIKNLEILQKDDKGFYILYKVNIDINGGSDLYDVFQAGMDYGRNN